MRYALMKAVAAPHTETEKLLTGLLYWHPSHNQAIQFLDCLASSFKCNQSALSDKCSAGAIDLLDQISDLIATDQIAQQSQQAWDDRPKRPLPGAFAGVLEQVESFTIRSHV